MEEQIQLVEPEANQEDLWTVGIPNFQAVFVHIRYTCGFEFFRGCTC